MKNLVDDSLRLLNKILSDTYLDYLLVHIAQSRLIVFSFPVAPEIPTIYGYIVDATPNFLQKQGIITFLSNYITLQDYKSLRLVGARNRGTDMLKNLLQTRYQKFTGESLNPTGYSFYTPSMKSIASLRGLYFVAIDRKKAVEWLNSLNRRILSPGDRDQWYTEEKLNIKTMDGDPKQANFSRSNILIKMFETFWNLWKLNPKGEYAREEVLKMYKKLFKEEINPDKIGHDVGNIRDKIMPKEVLESKRLEWVWDKKKKLWIFRFNPLKSTS